MHSPQVSVCSVSTRYTSFSAANSRLRHVVQQTQLRRHDWEIFEKNTSCPRVSRYALAVETYNFCVTFNYSTITKNTTIKLNRRRLLFITRTWMTKIDIIHESTVLHYIDVSLSQTMGMFVMPMSIFLWVPFCSIRRFIVLLPCDIHTKRDLGGQNYVCSFVHPTQTRVLYKM